MEAELQWFVDSEGQKVERELAEALRSIYDDIQGAVHEVAQERGADLVLTIDQLPGDTPDSPTQVRQMILLQKVLYWKPELDITDTVIARLNGRYKPQSPPPAVNEAPPARGKDAPAPAKDAGKPGAPKKP